MATLDELVQQAIQEKQKAPTAFGQRVLDSVDDPNPVTHIDGTPIDEFKKQVQSGKTSNDVLLAGAIAGKLREGTPEQQQSLLVTSPVAKTGDFALDNRGKTRSTAGPLGMSAQEIMGTEELFEEDFDFDSEEALRLQRAAEGVDFRKGLPFLQRLQIATSSPIPRAKAQRIVSTLSDEIRKVPEGIAPIQYDAALGQFYIASEITEDDVKQGYEPVDNIGKFRYVSLDGTGIEMADIADLMNLGEIGSIAGSVTGVAKAGKLLPFLKGRDALQTGTAAFGGGTAGRLTGDSLSVMLDVMNSDGEFIPTFEELKDMGLRAAEIEVVASAIGEGLGFGLKKSSEFVQDAYARMTGREGVRGTAANVSEANMNIAQTRDDLERVQTVTGADELVVSRGQASGSIDILELENSRLKNASPATRREVEAARAKSDRATEQFVDNVFGGDLQVWNGRHGVITAANRAIEDGNHLVTSTSDGIIGIHPMVAPESGLKIRPTGIDEWQVKGAQLPENLRGTGMGRDLYMTAVDEAAAHGAVLKSDDNVTEAAMRVWRSIDGDQKVGKLKWNPNAEFNETLKRWETFDGSPVVQMQPRDPFLPKLIEAFMRPGQGADGKIVANKEFARFLRKPGRGELGAVMKEIENNKILRQDLKEAIFSDYERNVAGKDGTFSVKEFEKWKAETQGMLERVFTPEEMLQVRKRGGLRRVVDAGSEAMESYEKSLTRVIGLKESAELLRDPAAGSTIYKQMKNMNAGKLRRTVALLQQGDMLAPIQELFKRDIKAIIKPKVSGRTASRPATQRLTDFIGENENLIRAMFPDSPNLAQQYVSDLRLVARMQERKALRSVVAGTREEANPSALAFTRVAFGPLSRAQRFFTAARRYTTRRMGEASVDMITDPAKLRLYMQIKDLPMSSRAVTQAFPRLYGQDFFDSINLDWNNPQQREAFINEVNEIRMVIDDVEE